jgi:hypothetical protein
MGLEIMVALVIVGGFSAAIFMYLSYAQATGLGSVVAYTGSTNSGGPCFFFLGSSKSVTALTLDQHGHPMAGVAVQITGLGISMSGISASNGTVLFSPVAPVLPTDASSGSLSIVAQYSASSLGGSSSAQQSSTACTVIK